MKKFKKIYFSCTQRRCYMGPTRIKIKSACRLITQAPPPQYQILQKSVQQFQRQNIQKEGERIYDLTNVRFIQYMQGEHKRFCMK
jgi:hypothetical protein